MVLKVYNICKKLFHQYIVQIKNNTHWYEVKGIDYINCIIVILYKCRLTTIPFINIEKIKVLGEIQEVNKK